MSSYDFWKARNRKDLLVEMQDNLNEFGELTSDEGKEILSEMSKLLNKLYLLHEDDFNPTQEMSQEMIEGHQNVDRILISQMIEGIKNFR